jgi:hypothetical protein
MIRDTSFERILPLIACALGVVVMLAVASVAMVVYATTK